jgi:hypothetical protein
MAGTTGLEPATSAVTGQRSNQLSYVPFVDLCGISLFLREHSPLEIRDQGVYEPHNGCPRSVI